MTIYVYPEKQGSDCDMPFCLYDAVYRIKDEKGTIILRCELHGRRFLGDLFYIIENLEKEKE